MNGNTTNATTLPPEVAQFVTDGKALAVSGSIVGALLTVLVCSLLYCCRRMRRETTGEAKEQRRIERKKRFEEATLRREEERRKLDEKRAKSAAKQRRGVNASYDARLDHQSAISVNAEDDGQLKKPSLLLDDNDSQSDEGWSPDARRASVIVQDRATAVSNSSIVSMHSPSRSASKKISPEQTSPTEFGQNPEETAVVESPPPPSPPRHKLFAPHLSVSRPVAIPRTAAEEAMQRSRYTVFQAAVAQHQREARAIEERRAREAEARLEEQRREAEKHRLDAQMLISGLRKESIIVRSSDPHLGGSPASSAATGGTKRMQVVPS